MSISKKILDTRIPVTILTGFLGAGKTTLLNNLIEKHPEKKFAIIENEFGEINIDSELIVKTDETIFELSNGCICCVLNEDLTSLLYELADSDKDFNHLIIETTGMADPGAVALNFISDFGVQQKFRLDAVIAIADAINLKKQLAETEEAPKQLAVADLILLNKQSAVSPEELAEAKGLIHAINSAATIHSCDYCALDGVSILNLKAFTAQFILATDFEQDRVAVSMLQNNKPLSHTHSAIKSVSLVVAGKLHPIIFDNWMTTMLLTGSIYRIKGILHMDGFDQKFVFQAVASQFVGELGPDWGKEERINKLVFIGKNLDKKILEAGFEKCFLSDN